MKIRKDPDKPPVNGWWVDTLVYEGRILAVVIAEDGQVWGIDFPHIEVTR